MKTELDSPKGCCVEKGVPNNLYLYIEPVVVALCQCLRGMHYDELRICYVFLAEIARAKPNLSRLPSREFWTIPW